MAKWTYESTKRGYENMWSKIAIKASDAKAADKFAKKIIAAEPIYRKIELALGVPWFFVGALHMRESGCNFAGVLHNGEHIIGKNKKTKLVPKGRGPFRSWEEAAIDALKLKNLHKGPRWTAARMGFESERFNGLGYIGKGVNSAYVWAGSNHEQKGKYVADHVWDKNFDDPQIGTMTVIKRICELRSDVNAQLAGRVADVPPDIPKPGTDAPKEGAPVEAKPSVFKRFWKYITGAGVFGTLTVGGITLNADIIYAFCAFVAVLFAVFLAYVYLIPPRGRIRKGLA